jgi:phosphoglucomutase
MDNKAKVIEKAKQYISQEKDAHFRQEVEALLANTDANAAELEDRFYRNLEFGTGGLRGVLGGGYNRMNTLVVKSATQGLAAYLKKAFPERAKKSPDAGGLSAAIAFDSRLYSYEFGEACALVFAANGIKTWLFSSMRPTPELSFAIRRLKCDTGIVITASHNPSQYNGYKAYWTDGAQVIPPHDSGIIDEVNAVTEICEMSRSEALAKGLLVIIDKEIDEPYLDMVRSTLFRPELIKQKAGDVKIVYTPLHGTGAMPVESVLGSLGLNVITVPEQREGDSAFPTVAFPNPEEAAALDMAIKLGVKENASVIMATDPDADRFGAALPSGKKNVSGENEYTLVTGNQMGSLLADYIFLSLKESGKLPVNAAMVNTIVTTGMQKMVAEHYGAKCIECLTGFKWISAVIAQCEKDKSATVVFGTEESYGYLANTAVRDKDGVLAAALTAEMTLYWQSKGKSLLDRLNELYAITGYWEEAGISKYFHGPQGTEIMNGIMNEYRKDPPKTLGGIEVLRVRDLEHGADGLPASDVLQFFLKDGTVVSARPSGTEPKIKFYASTRTSVSDRAALEGGLDAAKAEAGKKLSAIKQDIRRVIGD